MSGQKTSFGTSARESDEEEEVDRSTRRGLVSSWRQFANPSVCSRFPWIDVRNDGIYCVYCNHACVHGSTRSGSTIFVTEGFVGVR